MKALIVAALLAVTPVAATAQTAPALPADTDPITQSEIEARARICVGVITGKITDQQLVSGLQLDTSRKQRDFVLQCGLFVFGVKVGSTPAPVAEVDKKKI